MSPSCYFGYAVISFLLTVRFTTAALTSTGQTLLLNGIDYYVPATPYIKVSSLPILNSVASAAGLVPVTVVEVSAANSSQSSIEGIINGFGFDDVWNEGFLEGRSTRHPPVFIFEPQIHFEFSSCQIIILRAST